MKNCVTIYGCGKLGESLLKDLSFSNINLYKYSFGKPYMTKKYCSFYNNDVSIIGSNYLNYISIREYLKRDVSVIIVTLSGEQLNLKINFLLSLNIPLIICSTKYNKNLINEKVLMSNIPVFISDNFAIPIIDFWNRIKNMDSISGLNCSTLNVVESHQPDKKDVSGTAIYTIKFFKEKGFYVDFPNEKEYLVGETTSSGSITSIRGEKASLQYGVPKEFISGHAYHRFTFYFFTKKIAKKYYNYFESLNNYSQKGVIDFKVILNSKTLEIIYNINGREIYSYGISKALEYLKTSSGISTGIDLLE